MKMCHLLTFLVTAKIFSRGLSHKHGMGQPFYNTSEEVKI
jgi:hypothetical protein